MKDTVFIIPQGYPDNENKNMTPFIATHANLVKSLGFNIIVIYVKILPFKRWNNKNINKINISESNGIKKYQISMRYIKGLDNLNTYNYMKKVKKVFEKCIFDGYIPDFIEAHFSQYSGFAAANISKKYNVPLLVIEHSGSLLKKNIKKLDLIKLKYAYNYSTFFICVSDELKKSILRHLSIKGSDKLIVIPNSIDDTFYYNNYINKNKFVYFSAGNLYVGKRFKLLIEAFCEAFNNYENVELYIAGDGPEKCKLKELIKKNSRDKQIFLLGSLSKKQMLEQYIYCDAFVLASEHETFGIVYREAMIVGRPIITTSHQGFANNDWNDSYGIKVNIDSKKELIDALKRMTEEYKKFNGEEISKLNHEKYSQEIIRKKFNKVFLELLNIVKNEE